MSNTILSKEEKNFIIDGIRMDIRTDGRSNMDC